MDLPAITELEGMGILVLPVPNQFDSGALHRCISGFVARPSLVFPNCKPSSTDLSPCGFLFIRIAAQESGAEGSVIGVPTTATIC